MVSPLRLEIPTATATASAKNHHFAEVEDEEALYSPTSTVSDFNEEREAVFSRCSSRRSSVSSVASEDARAAYLANYQTPTDHGRPIAMYATLEQAALLSAVRAQAQAQLVDVTPAAATLAHAAELPRRLVTPGKLYENEEADDEIVEDEEGFFAA